jgi:transcriptional regulator with XRE-family HTH domain
MASRTIVPIAAKIELQRIGDRIRAVRLERRIPMQVLAEHAMTTRQTIGRMEAGDPGVAVGTVLAALEALDMLGTVAKVAAPGEDPMSGLEPTDLKSRRARRPNRASKKPGMPQSP